MNNVLEVASEDDPADDADAVEERVRKVCRFLRPHLAAMADNPQQINTGHVDGIFYWEAARGDFAARIARLREQWPQLPAISETGPDWVYSRSWALHDIWADFNVPMPAAEAHIVYYRPLSVREAVIAAVAPKHHPLYDEWLRIDIRSAMWDGDRVAEEIARSVGYDRLLGPRWLQPIPRTGDDSEIRIRFDPIPSTENNAPPGACDAIRVEVAIAPDLPAPHLIAALYEARVRAKGLHERLPDGGAARNRQHQRPAVAARTWATGLLIGVGYLYRSAVAIAASELAVDAVDYRTFQDDRRRLLDRVPEAKPFIPIQRTSA